MSFEVVVLRHAWAATPGDPRWADPDRPLTELGRDRFAAEARLLAARGVQPGIIASSPYVRCVETASILAAAQPHRVEVVFLDALQPGSNFEELLRWSWLQASRHTQVAWVGHAPDVGRMTAAMVGIQGGMIHFSKGAAGMVRFYEAPAADFGELRWLTTAKMLGC